MNLDILSKKLPPSADLRIDMLAEAGNKTIEKLIVDITRGLEGAQLLQTTRELDKIIAEIARSAKLL